MGFSRGYVCFIHVLQNYTGRMYELCISFEWPRRISGCWVEIWEYDKSAKPKIDTVMLFSKFIPLCMVGGLVS
jgi:hypothetical protein